ncbi:O-methyltransferase [Phytoactinopolyspora limicola]|uniref:O-methyltransferase n=1 Tax=Phytoactinopolyspora limicola TaxID=2715536 RepID=UPI00140D24E9|nr:O-methyltransferase [Phytoactinopolyspora limicola]
MSQHEWTAVDHYFEERFNPPDPALDAALQASDAAGLPAISVAANQGKLLQLVALAQGARRILEVGTLGGYSTIWLARALPSDGRLITLEADPTHAEVARANLDRAGLGALVDVRTGPALDTLPSLADDGPEPFDLVFIDANKDATAEYFDWALRLSRVGSVIVVDNVVRGGAVADPESNDPSVQGIQRFADRVAAEPRVSATTVQTVGSKGYDGFTMVVVTH